MVYKTYKCHKIVEAKPMCLGDYNTFKGWKIPDDEDPQRAGYLVKYSDEYTSWSPKEQFENGYTEIKVEDEE